MAGVKTLRKIQIGLESTPGTTVAATALIRGMGTLEDQREIVFPEEDIGLMSGGDRTYNPKLLGAITFDETEATFEQFPYPLSAGVKNVVTGAADGAGSGKIYSYNFTTAAQATVKTYTIEGGDDQQEEEMEYSFVSAFTLKGTAGEAWKASSDWQGRQIAPSTFTASIAIPTVEEMLFSKTLLYIDATTVGTTLKSNTLLDASLDVKTGITAINTADGQLYFSFIKQVQPEVILEVTFEHDSVSVAEKAAWRAQTTRLIQLKTTGSTLTTAGTIYSVKTQIINLAGKWEKFDKLGESDGNDIVKGTLRARYHSTSNLYYTHIIVNELASLT